MRSRPCSSQLSALDTVHGLSELPDLSDENPCPLHGVPLGGLMQ